MDAAIKKRIKYIVKSNESSSALPDLLGPNLQLVFCGSAAGTRSAQARAYYAGPGNFFWEVLQRTGLTKRKFAPQEYQLLKTCGIGLTDMVKQRVGNDGDLSSADFQPTLFRAKIEQYRPQAVGFNGKRAAQEFYRHPVQYGLQPQGIGATVVFVLPSTSGAARGFWNEAYWRDLADWIKNNRKE
jgi:TDG/mug DNA glycosylase family protein